LEMFDDVLSLRLKFQKAISRQYKDDGGDQSDEIQEEESLIESANEVNSMNMFSNFAGNDADIAKRNSQRLAAQKQDAPKGKAEQAVSDHEDDKLTGAPKTKERTVGYVIEKVAQWRRLYNGTYD